MRVSKRLVAVCVGAFLLFAGLPALDADAGCVFTGSVPRCNGGGGGGGNPFGGGGGGGGAQSTPPKISIKNESKAEGTSEGSNTTFRFKVVLNHASDDVVKVDYATSPGSATESCPTCGLVGADYAQKDGTISFPAGSTTKNVKITVFADFDPEADEQFFVELSNAKKGKIKDGQGVGTIEDDDVGEPV